VCARTRQACGAGARQWELQAGGQAAAAGRGGGLPPCLKDLLDLDQVRALPRSVQPRGAPGERTRARAAREERESRGAPVSSDGQQRLRRRALHDARHPRRAVLLGRSKPQRKLLVPEEAVEVALASLAAAAARPAGDGRQRPGQVESARRRRL